jgi:type IX secretion system PorP/SprF family membrane protein
MKHLKIVFISLAIFSMVPQLKGQQLSQYSQYFFNPVALNPGYAGSNDNWTLTGVNRNQWMGMPGAPVTRNFGVEGGIKDYRLGLAAQIGTDKAGPLSKTGFTGTVAYWLPLGKNKLSFGLQGNVSQLYLQTDQLILANSSDLVFIGDRQNSLVSDANFGIHFHGNSFYVGASAFNLMESRFNMLNSGSQFQRHYNFFAGSLFKVSDDVYYRPSTQIRMVTNTPLNIDFTNSFVFNQKLLLGMGFRANKSKADGFKNDQLIWIINLWLNDQIKLGYSYDSDLNELARNNSGSHEVAISYFLPNKKSKNFQPKYF